MRLHRRRTRALLMAVLALLMLAASSRFLLPRLDNAIRTEAAARRDLDARRTTQALAQYQPLAAQLALPLPPQPQLIATLQTLAAQLALGQASYSLGPARVDSGLAVQPVSIALPVAGKTTGLAVLRKLAALLPNALRLASLTYEARADGSGGHARLELDVLGTP